MSDEITDHLDTIKTMLNEMEEQNIKSKEFQGKIDKNQAIAHENWKAKWEKIYDMKFLDEVEAIRAD